VAVKKPGGAINVSAHTAVFVEPLSRSLCTDDVILSGIMPAAPFSGAIDCLIFTMTYHRKAMIWEGVCGILRRFSACGYCLNEWQIK
jgi:hypothetical protein